jgi:hypothetical protein
LDWGVLFTLPWLGLHSTGIVIEVRKNWRLDVKLCLIYFVVIVEFVGEEQSHEHELHHAVIVISEKACQLSLKIK